jgi:hypothetical protein
MRCKVRRLLQRVAAFYRLEDQDVDDQAEIWAAGEVASEETTTGRCKLTKELRMQCAPKKYKDFLQVSTAPQLDRRRGASRAAGRCAGKLMPCVLGVSHTQAASDGPCTVKVVDLSFCQLQDDDLDGITAALAGFNDVETLDLQYNELQVRAFRGSPAWCVATAFESAPQPQLSGGLSRISPFRSSWCCSLEAGCLRLSVCCSATTSLSRPAEPC